MRAVLTIKKMSFWLLLASCLITRIKSEHHGHDHDHDGDGDEGHDHNGEENSQDLGVITVSTDQDSHDTCQKSEHHAHNHHDEHDHNEHDHTHGHNHGHSLNDAEFWAILAALLIGVWAVSILCSLIPKRTAVRFNQELLAACVGTLLCSLFFELVPHALFSYYELVSHDNKSSDRITDVSSSVILVGIFFGFLLENVVHFTSSAGNTHFHISHGGHHHDNKPGEPDLEKSDVGENKPEKKPFLTQIKNLPAIIWVDIVAKLVHNFIDGVLIGSMSGSGVQSWFTVAMSVAAHEIASNIGSFSMYVGIGLSKKVSVFVCGFNSISVIAGGFIAAALGRKNTDSAFFKYIPFFSVGIFLYLTLSDMIPLLTHPHFSAEESKRRCERSSKKKVAEVVIMVTCFIVGFFVLFTILHFFGHKH